MKVRLTDSSRISLFNYLYFFCIIIFAGSASAFARSWNAINSPNSLFALFMTICFIVINKIRFKPNFIGVLTLFTMYAVITFVQNGVVSPLWLSMWWISFCVTYVLISHCRERIFVVYETIIVHLCVISLIFWCLYLVSPELVNSIVESLQFSKSYSEDIQSKNIIIYTLLDDTRLMNEFVTIPRNAGFAWEPGAFACMICLAICCNIFRTNFRLFHNMQLIILLLTLLTTASTTGYLVLLILIIVYLISNRKYWILLIGLPLIIACFQLPFVKDKFLEEYGNMDYVNIAAYDDEVNHALGRMMSLKLDWEEFLRHPIFGLGGYSEGTWLFQQGYDNISTISGIGKLLSRYGLIMAILFVFVLIKSAKLIGAHLKNNAGWLVFIVVIGTMVSYDLWTQPVYMLFWMYGIWGPRNIIQTRKSTIK